MVFYLSPVMSSAVRLVGTVETSAAPLARRTSSPAILPLTELLLPLLSIRLLGLLLAVLALTANG
jgi:hypothetical protein